MALLGVQVELRLTLRTPAISTHAPCSFKTPSIDSDPFDRRDRLTLLCRNYFGQFSFLLQYIGCQSSSVSIATPYGLDGPGIESRCIRVSRCCPDWSRGPPSHLYNRCLIFTEAKCPWRGADHPPLTSTVLRMGWNCTFATALCCFGVSWGDLQLLTLYRPQ
jgi:hypothetical protein